MYLTNQHWKNIKKRLIILGSILFITIILSLLQYAIHYYNNPLITKTSFSATGCIVYDLHKEKDDFEPVKVEVYGENLNYIFHNKEDYIRGDILVHGYSLFGKDRNKESPGFYTGFYQDSPYTCTAIGDEGYLCEIIGISNDFSAIVCGITVDATIGKRQGEQALLVILADDENDVIDVVNELAANSQQMKDWLTENGWIQDL